MIVAVHQPNYLPWLGYFSKMSHSDVFILLDDVDISLGGAAAITHRAKIMGSNGPTLLPIPLRRDSGPAIKDVVIADDHRWSEKHARTLDSGYGQSPHFAALRPILHAALGSKPEKLVDLTVPLIESMRDLLGLRAQILLASRLGIPGTNASDRLAGLCREVGGTVYLSGQGGRSYNEPAAFERRAIELRYTSFQHPTYEQGKHPFAPGLSIVDALAWLGRDSVGAMLNRSPE